VTRRGAPCEGSAKSCEMRRDAAEPGLGGGASRSADRSRPSWGERGCVEAIVMTNYDPLILTALPGMGIYRRASLAGAHPSA
jgi:hypothetical protein